MAKALILQSQKCPTDELSLTNCLIVNPQDYDSNSVKYVQIKHVTGAPHRFVFGLKNHASMRRGELGFNLMQRKWAEVSLGEKLEVSPFPFTENDYISSITLQADFLMKKNTTTDPYDTDKMAQEFLMQFPRQPFTIGQLIVFQFLDKKHLELTVIDMEAADISAIASGQQTHPRKFAHGKAGVLIPNTNVIFDKAPDSMLNLSGKSKGKTAYRSIINPDWDFEKMGIGGLDHEFNAIFRRAFASRVFPPEFIEQLGMKHVRGILLYGPPGTGKTLMARQIGKMLNAREPKIVNGPQILDKYVGESEANIRKLFADAEEENKRVGANSGLHIIIFDEIDAICKQRGSVAGSSAVHDTVVNQLLSKIDGVDQLNNILVIGMTNRRDMIDEALLRPGRLEVQIEISLPDKKGRVQILNIHTSRMREHKKIAGDVDIEELSDLTKNFSGAELEGLVRAAQSSAMNRLVKAASKVQVDPDAIEKLMINRDDFLYALANDVKPAFGLAAEKVQRLLARGIIPWGEPVERILTDGALLVQQAKAPDSLGLVSVLLEGPPMTGKSALAAKIALDSDFPFMKVCSPDDMVGYSETAKCAMIRKMFDDAYKSPLSVILVDNLERLLDYNRMGPRYSNLVAQALMVLFQNPPPQGRKLLILATSSAKEMLEQMEMFCMFDKSLHCAALIEPRHVMNVMESSAAFSDAELQQFQKVLNGKDLCIGVKKLLSIIDFLKQTEEKYRVMKFEQCMYEEAGLSLKS